MLLGLLAAPSLVRAWPRDLLRVLTGPDPGAQRLILQALRVRFPGLQAEADPASWDARRNGSPVLALGPIALRRALDTAEASGPLVSLFASSQTYRRLTAASARDKGAVSGIYADASPLAQMQLAAALFDGRTAMGALLSESSAYLERPLRLAAAQTGIELTIERVDTTRQDPVRALNALSGASVLLAVPDSTLYTPDTLRAVLESTYRRGLPVLGFSAATVAAGTLASAYPDIEDVIADVAELLDNASGAGNAVSLPDARYPRYWRVAVNDNVARSLGIAISDKARALGARPPANTGKAG